MVYDSDFEDGMRTKIEPFHGKSRSEGSRFLLLLDLNIGGNKEFFPSDQKIIDYAVPYLKGAAATVWSARYSRSGTGEITYEQFREFVLNVPMVMNPYRLVELACKFNETRQQEGQSVRDFALDLMTLECEMGGQYTDEQQA